MSHHGGPCVMQNTDQFYVRVCGCGIVHLNFGATVVNVSPETAIAISETLKEVTSELRKHYHQDDPVNSNQATLDASGNVIYGKFPNQTSKP